MPEPTRTYDLPEARGERRLSLVLGVACYVLRAVCQVKIIGFIVIFDAEFQTFPAGGETWRGDRAVVGEPEAAKAHHYCLPHPTGRGSVNSVPGIAAQVFQIHQRSPHKVLVGLRRFPQVTSQDGVNGRTQ